MISGLSLPFKYFTTILELLGLISHLVFLIANVGSSSGRERELLEELASLSDGGFARTAAKPKPAKPKRKHLNHSLCFFPAVPPPFSSPCSKEFISIFDICYLKFVCVLSLLSDKGYNFFKKKLKTNVCLVITI